MIEERLRKLIVYVGDEGSKVELRDTNKIHEVLETSLAKEEPPNRAALVQFLVKALSTIPNKQHIYALLTAKLSASYADLAQEILSSALDQLQTLLNQCELHSSKNILVYLSELMNIDLMNSFVFFGILEDILSELEKSTSSYRTFYLEIIIKVLPFCWNGLHTKISTEFRKFLEKLKRIVEPADFQLSQYWNIFYNLYTSGKLKDYSLINALNHECKVNTQYQPKFKLAFKDKVVNPNYSPLPAFKIEDSDESYREFTDSIDAYIHAENISNIVYAFKNSRKLLVDKLVLYIVNSQNTFMCKYLIERLMKQALSNQTPDLIVYSSTLMHLANESDENLRIELRRAIEESALNILNKVLDHMELDFIERFSDLISFYASNYTQIWDWARWISPTTEQEQPSLKRSMFLKLTFQKVTILSEKAFAKETTSKELARFLPPGDKKYVLNPRDSKPQEGFIKVISQKLQAKADADKMIEEIGNQNQYEMFLECLLVRMSNSINHLNILAERYKKVFLHFGSKYEKPMLTCINAFWNHSQYHKTQYFSLFISKGIISFESFVEWLSHEAKLSDVLEKLFLTRLFEKVGQQTGEVCDNQELLSELKKCLVD